MGVGGHDGRDLEAALSREREARLRAEASERRAEFLASASATLASSLDYERTLQQVARLAVPTLADASGVYLLQPDGALRQLAAAHVDPAKEPLLWELVELIPIHIDQDRVLCRAVRDRRAELVADVTDVARGRWSPSSRAEEIVGILGLRSYIAAPLVIRDQVLGAIAFSAAESGRQFDEHDLRLAEDIGRRAAVAIEKRTLLDVSRIVEGRMVLDVEIVDLGELTREVVDRFSDEAPGGSTITLDASHGVVGEWDRFRLDQVVSNLVSNALKYGDGKVVDVKVREGDEHAELVVRDRGIGIEPAEQARIFERFERAVTGRRFGGFGLGLWIARQFIEASGGSIHVESRKGVGSTFTVRLPRRRSSASIS